MATLIDVADSPQINDELNFVTGGFITNTELHLLAPNQAGRLLNIDPTVAGRVQKRLGPQPKGSAGLGNPNALQAFEDLTGGLQALVGQWGSALFSSNGLSDDWTRRASQISLANTAYMGAQGRGVGNARTLFMSSCVPVSDNTSLPYGNIVAIRNDYNATEIAVRARAIQWFQTRLWAFNFAASGADYLAWSSPLNGTDFSNGQNVQITSAVGDQGMAILPLRDQTPRMFLFKERSIHLLEIFWATDGYYPTTANALDFTKSVLRPVVLDTGLVSSRAALWVPGVENADALFLSREGIRSLQRSLTDAQGGASKPLSHRIRPTIDRINWVHADRSVAGFWNNRVYFAVPVNGSEVNNFVIAYDIDRDAFYELDFDVAEWRPAVVRNERNFFFLSSTHGTESALGSSSGTTDGFHVYQTDVGNIDPYGQPIQLDLQTRAFSFDNDPQKPGSGLRYKKKWNYLDLAVQSDGTGATLLVQYKVDDDDSFSTLAAAFVDPSDSYPFLPVQLPFSFSTGRLQRRGFLLRDVRPGYKIQFRIADQTSFARTKIISLTAYAHPLNPQFRGR